MRRLLAAPLTIAGDVLYEAALLIDMVAMAVAGGDCNV